MARHGLLTASDHSEVANHNTLRDALAMDSTTLTRTLGLLLKQGWVRVRRGRDRRARLFSLTRAGQRQLAAAEPCWAAAQDRLRKGLGTGGRKGMKQAVSQLTEAALLA